MSTRRLLTVCLCLLVSAMVVSVLAAAPERVKLQVNDPALAERLRTEFGGRLVADYGSYQLLEVDWQAAADVAGEPGQLRCDEYDHIALNTGWLPTAPGLAPARAKTVEVFSGKRLHLVQFAGPIQPQWYDELLAAGVEVVTYIPFNSYLVYGDTQALGRIRSMADTKAYVQWEGDYLVDYRIQPGARIEDFAKGEPLPDAYTFQLVQDAKANDATVDLIRKFGLGKVLQDYSILNYRNVTILVPEERLPEIASRPDVVSVQPWSVPELHDERQDQIMRNYLTGNLPSGPGYLAWLLGLGFTQQQFTTSGFVVDVTDSGLDNATTSPNHFALYVEGVRPGTSRVAYSRIEGSPGANAGKGCDGHGTLNAHIVAGYNNLTGAYHEDASGYNYGLGVCPWVKVGSSVVFDPGWTNGSYTNLQSTAYANGARISTNSWGGTGNFGNYTSDSQTYDSLVRDAQSGTAGNQEMVICFSAGNAGSGANTIGWPGTGKNVFTIGAAENVNQFGGSDASGIGDSGSDNANDIIYFSSRGPCDDGRIKPDIQAPGTHIGGGVFQIASPPVGGQADACFDGSGVSGGPSGSLFWPTTQQWTTASSGTSHSTPAMAGASALLRQWFINHGLAVPSPAMNKAYLMNSTRYMTGVGANDNLYSNSQGMGEVDLTRAFDGVARVLIDQTQVFTASGQNRVITGNISDNTQPFRVTLAWTDPPGPTSGNAYINNLDLTVTVGGVTYLGNVFSGANSAAGGTADLKDNVESVFAPAGVTGPYTVTIAATNIAGDGVPGNGTPLDQDYALVIYNANEVQQPVINGESATLETEGCNPANGAPDPGETVTYSITLKNVGTAATANLVATLQATGGVTNPDSPQTFGAIAPGASAAMPFTFVVDPALACGDPLTLTLDLQDGATNLGTATFHLTTGELVVVTAFSDDMESGVGGWTTQLVSGNTNWAQVTTLSHSPTHSWFSPDEGNIKDNYLITQQISIPANSTMTFWHNYTTEQGYDGCVIEITTDGGSNWTDLGTYITVNGYTRSISTSYSSPIGGRMAWSGTSGGWIQSSVNLASYGGQSVKIRFRIACDSSLSSTGWYVDDVIISVASRVCCEGQSIPKGDLNHDYVVDGLDLLILASYLGGADLPAGTTVGECDLIVDGVINSADLAWLQNKVAGNI